MIKLRLLGPPAIDDSDGRNSAQLLKHPKRLALLAYLAVNSGESAPRRDTLLALLWPELDSERARHALRQSLHTLRTMLGPDVIPAEGGEHVRVRADALSCDVIDLERALADGRTLEAIELYRGTLLEGFFVADAPAFERWADDTGARLRLRVIAAAQELAEEAMVRGDPDQAVHLLRFALRHAGADETILRRILELLDSQGNRAAAISVYEEFIAQLREDYDLDASPETAALVARIRTRAEHSRQLVTRELALPVRVSPDTFAELPELPAESAFPQGFRFTRGRAALVASALTVTLLGAFLPWGRWLLRPTVEPGSSVAVLPFIDLSETRDQEYLSDGLTEELITALSKVQGLRVPARTSSFVFKNVPANVREIARKLNVSAVLEGSVRRDGNRLRITAQLIDARSGYHLWSENYDRDLRELFAVQDEISRAIAKALELELIGKRGQQLVTQSTSSPAAYNAYLKGLYFWNQRNHDDLKRAIDYFREAIREDQGYAVAHAGLAGAYQLAPTFDVLPPGEAFPLARAAAVKALELDPASAEAHAAFGYIKMHWDRDWPGAEAELKRAIELNPGYATAHQWLRLFLLVRGRHAEALAAARRAQELDPLSISINAALADTYFYTRQYATAESVYHVALELDPGFARARAGLGRTYMQMNRAAEGIAEQEKAVAGTNPDPRRLAQLGAAYARTGKRAEAARVLSSLREISQQRGLSAYAFATIHAGFGQRDSALYWLERAAADHDNWAVYIIVEPGFDALRGDPRFDRIVGTLGLNARDTTRAAAGAR